MKRYESSEVGTRGALGLVIALIGLLAFANLITFNLQRGFIALRTQTEPRPAPSSRPSETATRLVSEPPLPGTPKDPLFGPGVVAAQRRTEEGWLSAYGWLDRDRGVVHLPIDRAMELLVERGPGAQEGTP